MSSESEERRPTGLQNMGTRPAEPENLPCPRCESTNTKFCYYNNYNLSQPRHFCKSCRRYWTRGGTLRNVPIGGGTRKASNKRSRTNPTATSSSSSSSTVTYDGIPANPVPAMPGIKPEMGSGSPLCGDVNLNETVPESFNSLLNTQQGAGFVPLGGFGLGLGPGLPGMGFGLSTWDWPMEQVGEANGGDNGGSVSGASSGCNTWQIGGVEGGLSEGDCFGWPDLAISTPGNVLK